MSIKFKKGRIIPRWCHVKTEDRKAHHCCTFDCDVEVVLHEGTVRIYPLTYGAVILVRGSKGPARRMKGGSIKYSRAVYGEFYIDTSRMQGADDFSAVVPPAEPFYQMPESKWWKQDGASFSVKRISSEGGAS